jgi:hypothetical protein
MPTTVLNGRDVAVRRHLLERCGAGRSRCRASGRSLEEVVLALDLEEVVFADAVELRGG